MIDVAAKYNVM